MNQNTMELTSLRDTEFKDASPLATVERIKSILAANGIATEEHWNESGVPYCHSIILRVSDTAFSVNGKGLTRELALASGYGELMERLQLGFIGKFDVQKDGHHTADTSRFEMRSPQQLLDEHRPWFDVMAKRLEKETGSTITAEEILAQITQKDGLIPTDSFFNLTTGQRVNYPKALWSRIYSSNGCAAGNTTEEALVQAISEVVEREYRTRIVLEDISLPNIPDEFLQQFDVSYRIIQYVRQHGFRVLVKDCSLGQKFPVVCVCFIDEESGRYHTHFGAYPIFEIALTRALTETFQGRHIKNIAAFTDFTRKGSKDDALLSMKHEFVKGTWEKHAGFFVGEPQYPFHEDVGFTGKNNHELLLECVDFFKAMGCEILVRDGSSLGFPTYQVLVPGYSEVFTYRLDKKLYEFRYFDFAVKALRNPSKAGFEDLLGLLMHMDQIKASIGSHGFLAGSKLSADLTPEDEARLMAASLAYVQYTLGRYGTVIKYLDTLIDAYSADDAAFLICLKRYLTLLESGTDKAQIRKILQFFHREPVVTRLYDILGRNGNPLEDFTLHCDMSCTQSCPIQKVCFQKRTVALTRLINEKIKALDFDAFVSKLQSLL
jgi:ribosomal protein S12 methylthiotransferase accessory factor